MLCETLKAGQECAFMSKSGCTYNGGVCHTIVDECEGCARVLELDGGKYCTSYPDPKLKWKWGACNFATHVTKEKKQEVRINPLKAAKRRKKA